MDEIYVQELFDRLHKVPERGFEELETSKILIEELKKCGFEVYENMGITGVVAIYESKNPGPTLALRADMDALEFIIEGEVVNIHACGHDANCAMVMAAAKECKEKGIKKGVLKIIFQPAEELTGGASEALLALDIRCESNEIMTIMKEKIRLAIDMSVRAVGAFAEEIYFGEVIAAMYDEEMIESCKKSIEKVIGKSFGRIVNYGGEDFHYFTRDLGCKSSYLGIGAEATPGLHHEKMTFKREALNIGEKILIEIVNERLGVI